MKLTTFILMIALTQVSAAIFAQKLTFSKQGTNLQEIFAEIESQTGYSVLYAPAKVNTSKKYNVKFLNAELTEVLETVLKPAALEYRIENRNILVKEQEKTFPESLAERRADIDVRGRVVDTSGEGLPGATVQVKGTNKSTMTTASGTFVIRDVAEDAVLQVSYIGFKTRELAVQVDMGNILLEAANSDLDEIQVIAYGTTTRRLSTSNIGSVKAEDIDRQPVNNPLLALQGKVPGLFMNQQSGIPGSNVTVRIQGENSIASGNAPFYVVDGVPYSADMLPGLSAISGLTTGGSALSFINPATIESVEVLKDADATAIYGSRAANGAILITTKKGKAGTSKVDLRLQNGWGKVSRMREMLNTEQYLMIRKEAYKNDGLPVPTPNIPDAQKTGVNYDLTVWDQNRYTDWQKVLIGGTAQYQDAQASISGGSNTTQFLFNAGYHRESSVFPGNLADSKGSVQLSVNHNSPNQKFRFQFSGNYLEDRNRLINTDLTNTAATLAPNAPELYKADGSLNFEPYNGVSTWNNPLRQLLIPYQYNTQNLVSNTVLSYELIKGLNLRSSFGYTKTLSDEKVKTPVAAVQPEDLATFVRRSKYSDKSASNWIIEPNVNYKRQVFKGVLDVLLGATFQQTRNVLSAFEASGFSNDEQMDNILAAPTVIVTNAIQSEYNYNAVFGRINYVFDNKYIINLSGRRDGSSRFGSENLFQNFYAIGGAWIFSDEKWLKEKMKWLSFGKLRASYGITGNDQIGDYGFLALYNAVPFIQIPYQGTVGLLPNNHSNAYLQWEQTRKMNVGIDLGFVKDRILLNANYYRNRSSNQLVNAPLSVITGFNTVRINLPAVVQNTGLELQLETKNIMTKGFEWSSSFNFTIPRNKLVAFPGLETSTYNNRLIVGEPLGILKRYKFAGVDPQTGLYQFVKANGNLTTAPTSSVDATSIINTQPKVYGGLQNNLKYKGFELDFFLQFSSQLGFSRRFGVRPGFTGNEPVYVLDRWQKPGDQSKYGKVSTALPSTNTNALSSSDVVYISAALLRLRNVALSWQFPEQWRGTSKLQNARFFIQGQNLLTFTGIDLDPETLSPGDLPSLRTITIGMQVGF